MTTAEEHLARIGFGTPHMEAACWRTTRLDGPVWRETGADPACSRGLQRWRVLLARSPRQSPYRISRIGR